MNDTAAPGLPEARRYASPRQKVPPFARYKGTSAWKKFRRRAREYARFLAATSQATANPGTQSR